MGAGCMDTYERPRWGQAIREMLYFRKRNFAINVITCCSSGCSWMGIEKFYKSKAFTKHSENIEISFIRLHSFTGLFCDVEQCFVDWA
jgi:hypothetical protein